ncbi:hypothetical protein SteCoe_33886 [Stentor coeruleus]|uniref:Ubiquitin-like protease family profile domain-containing protein n=1 Tax=Stentor coeruleus TaxID=5963 RepID=A0A1R2AVQ0_9CILI|nr:hypothetical protein SteCoe_33886 [Stentor coeruleus]
MEYLSKPFALLKATFQKNNQPRVSSRVLIQRKKINIIKPDHINSKGFYFPKSDNDLCNGSEELENFFDFNSHSGETLQKRIQLISDTIVYAQKKIRKLSASQSISQVNFLFNEQEAREVYDEWTDPQNESIIKCLAPGESINDKTMDLFVALIPCNKSIHIMTSDFYKSSKKLVQSYAKTMKNTVTSLTDTSEESYNPSEYMQCLKKSGLKSLLDKPYVLVPIREENWSLICVNNENKVLEYFSSNPEDEHEEVCLNLEKIIKECEGVEEYDWELIDMPKENSPCDSGVFVMLAIKALALNQPFDFSYENIEQYRTLISIELNKSALL